MSETKIEVANSSGAASLYAALSDDSTLMLIGKTRKSDKLNVSLIGYTHEQAEEFAWGILDLLHAAGYYKAGDICQTCDGPFPKDSAGRLDNEEEAPQESQESA